MHAPETIKALNDRVVDNQQRFRELAESRSPLPQPVAVPANQEKEKSNDVA